MRLDVLIKKESKELNRSEMGVSKSLKRWGGPFGPQEKTNYIGYNIKFLATKSIHTSADPKVPSMELLTLEHPSGC